MTRNKAALFTSNSDEWCTPRDLFDRLNAEYQFEVDAAATKENALCKKFWTKETDGLKQDWTKVENIWINPPYSRVSEWVNKAFFNSMRGPAKDGSVKRIVMLLPARTDTRWFHDFIWRNSKCRGHEFLRGRLKFSGAKNSAPFPSMLVFF